MSVPTHRREAAARIQRETGVRVEAMDNQNIFAYTVDGVCADSAAEARRLARRIDDDERADLGMAPRWTSRQKGE